jgi:hypothetical protein
VAIVLDNCGLELLSDLVLADGVLYATQALDVTSPVLQALQASKAVAPAAAPATSASSSSASASGRPRRSTRRDVNYSEFYQRLSLPL